MASFPQQEVSFASGTSTRSYKPNTTRIQPYVSPFVAEAKRRAELRVRERMRKYSSSGRRPSPPAVSSQDRGEWNQSVQAPTLFDPQLRKQEIFRLGPKTAARNESQRSEHDRNDSARIEKIIRSSSAPRMTVRASSSIPTKGGMQNRFRSRVDDQVIKNEVTLCIVDILVVLFILLFVCLWAPCRMPILNTLNTQHQLFFQNRPPRFPDPESPDLRLPSMIEL